jgi:hypothetical protein
MNMRKTYLHAIVTPLLHLRNRSGEVFKPGERLRVNKVHARKLLLDLIDGKSVTGNSMPRQIRGVFHTQVDIVEAPPSTDTTDADKRRRANFRRAVFKRDGQRCVMCGRSAVKLDAHHIVDRHQAADGGYVLENGITLCDCFLGCHWKAERYHATGTAYPGYAPEDLLARIGARILAPIKEAPAS